MFVRVLAIAVLAGALVAAQTDRRETILVTRVFPKSPAAKAGLKVGDIVTEIGTKAVHGGDELQKVILSLPLGKPVEVAYLRDGESETAKVVVEEQPEEYGLERLTDDE